MFHFEYKKPQCFKKQRQYQHIKERSRSIDVYVGLPNIYLPVILTKSLVFVLDANKMI